jgi:hypothetical protein
MRIAYDKEALLDGFAVASAAARAAFGDPDLYLENISKNHSILKFRSSGIVSAIMCTWSKENAASRCDTRN